MRRRALRRERGRIDDDDDYTIIKLANIMMKKNEMSISWNVYIDWNCMMMIVKIKMKNRRDDNNEEEDYDDDDGDDAVFMVYFL